MVLVEVLEHVVDKQGLILEAALIEVNATLALVVGTIGEHVIAGAVRAQIEAVCVVVLELVYIAGRVVEDDADGHEDQ